MQMAMIQLLFLFVSASLVALRPQLTVGANLGMCYLPSGGAVPSPDTAVRVCQQYHNGRLRLYHPDPATLSALHGTTVQLILGVPNSDIRAIASSLSAADEWICRHVLPHHPFVHFRYIVVGNDTLISDCADGSLYAAMNNLFVVLSRRGLDCDIKVSTAISIAALSSFHPPSQASFLPGLSIQPIAKFLEKHKAPLLVNVYPYFEYLRGGGKFSLPFALFKQGSNGLQDGEHYYNNMFDEMVDAFYAALEKIGVSRVRVAVSETGWPSGKSDGCDSDSNAKEYIWNLIQHVLSYRGTPRMPGKQIETYIFSMFNENGLGGSMQNFGLFQADGEPVYGFPTLKD